MNDNPNNEIATFNVHVAYQDGTVSIQPEESNIEPDETPDIRCSNCNGKAKGQWGDKYWFSVYHDGATYVFCTAKCMKSYRYEGEQYETPPNVNIKGDIEVNP